MIGIKINNEEITRRVVHYSPSKEFLVRQEIVKNLEINGKKKKITVLIWNITQWINNYLHHKVVPVYLYA